MMKVDKLTSGKEVLSSAVINESGNAHIMGKINTARSPYNGPVEY